jgi:hypothetical protein
MGKLTVLGPTPADDVIYEIDGEDRVMASTDPSIPPFGVKSVQRLSQSKRSPWSHD